MRRIKAKSNCAVCVLVCAAVLAACGDDESDPTGASGSAGAAANAGNSGTSGSSGASGASAGTAGTSGTPAGGASGLGGSSGASGGASGTAGTSAGASGAAGTAGAAGMGASAGVGSTACGSENVCDDFESYEPGAGFGDWQQNGSSGVLTVDGVHVFSGEQSAHFQIEPGANKRLQLERTGAPIFPAQNNAFWGRVMVWAEDLPLESNTENKDVHYDVIQASGEGPGEYRVAGMGGVLLNYEPHDCYYGTNKVIPEDRWACWEWLYDGSSNVIEFYIDGVLQARVESMGQGCVDGTDSVWEAPQFDELRIGFVNYQSKAETVDIWMDDFAVGPERIGCPEPSSGTH